MVHGVIISFFHSMTNNSVLALQDVLCGKKTMSRLCIVKKHDTKYGNVPV